MRPEKGQVFTNINHSNSSLNIFLTFQFSLLKVTAPDSKDSCGSFYYKLKKLFLRLKIISLLKLYYYYDLDRIVIYIIL